MTEYPVTAKIAAKRLGVAVPTLNRWLVDDQERAPDKPCNQCKQLSDQIPYQPRQIEGCGDHPGAHQTFRHENSLGYSADRIREFRR
jgi:hypothetical protein